MLAAIFAYPTICTLDTQPSFSYMNMREKSRGQEVMTTAWCPESRVTQVPSCSCA
jgi:hypothetical protein